MYCTLSNGHGHLGNSGFVFMRPRFFSSRISRIFFDTLTLGGGFYQIHPIQIGAQTPTHHHLHTHTHSSRSSKSCRTNSAPENIETTNSRTNTHKKRVALGFYGFSAAHLSEYLQVPPTRRSRHPEFTRRQRHQQRACVCVCSRGVGGSAGPRALWRRLIYPPLYCFCLMHRHDRARRTRAPIA